MTGLKGLKKGDQVVLVGFTGIRLSTFKITAITKKEITISTAEKGDLTFDIATGKQTNANNPKYANKIMHPDDAPVNKKAAKKTDKKDAKKATDAKKKSAPVVEDEEDEDEDEEPAPKKKAKKKEEPKKAKKASKPEPEDEDEEDEEDDDEEYEEV